LRITGTDTALLYQAADAAAKATLAAAPRPNPATASTSAPPGTVGGRIGSPDQSPDGSIEPIRD